jgi:DNA-binding CsgD family transcriptional regulator
VRLTSPSLVERDWELDRVACALDAAGPGRGRLLVVEGPAGIGKSAILAAGAKAGRDRGWVVLAVVAGEFERELGFGVVRGLFEPALLRLGPHEREAVLTGAAGLTRRLLLPSVDANESSAPDLAALMHGLYWLAANLSERAPLMLCVDDAQWCDPSSLAWLLYLARRLEDLSIVLVVAVRSGELKTQGGPLAGLADSAVVSERLKLSPLSEAGSTSLVRNAWTSLADEALCQACFEVTGGNPFLLRELGRALEAEVSSTGPALVDRVRRLTPRTVSRSVIARLRRLPGEATELAYALAVLGGRAEPGELLAVSGVDRESGLRALDLLEREQIAGGRPVIFIHPLVGTAITGELPQSTWLLAHARAARALADAGSDPARLASHLLHTEPAGDEWTVGVLRRAALDATRRGAPETAARWLSRALAEPPVPAERPLVLHELGAAELLAGPSGDGSMVAAEEHLAAAVQSASEPRAKALAALDWGDAVWSTHRYRDAVLVFDRAIDAVRDADGELALRIEAHALAAARLDLDTCRLASTRLRRLGDEPPPTPGGRLIAGVLAVDRALAGAPADDVAALAETMLDGDRIPSGQIAAQIPLFATNALLWSERFDQSRRLLEQMIAGARAAGSARGVMIGLCWRALAAHRQGELNEAVSDLATALELAAVHSSGGTVVTHAMFAEVLLDQGDIAGADDTMAAIPVPDDLPGYIGWNYFLHARGAVRAAKLEPRAALQDFLACGDRQNAWGARNPSVIPWRSSAALAWLSIGDRDRASELAGEELELARSFGAPRSIGIALRALGLAANGCERVRLLRESASELERSDARLEHARALTDLGGALRRTGERAAAREPLQRALDLANRCGAGPLVDRARNELLATGSRPRKQLRTGADALTPIERQAATLAADGLSNPQIAQALFISRKTVEKRLSEAYRKLDIRSRDQIADALAEPGAAIPTVG